MPVTQYLKYKTLFIINLPKSENNFPVEINLNLCLSNRKKIKRKNYYNHIYKVNHWQPTLRLFSSYVAVYIFLS